MSRTEPTAPHNDGTTGERAGNATSGASANADQPLRQSGIRVVGEVPWGSHICIFYETKDDLLDTAAAYFKAGLGDLGADYRGRCQDGAAKRHPGPGGTTRGRTD